MSVSQKRIGFAGTRGLPANYGGFETAVDELTRRFVENGYKCDVFCRISHSGSGPLEGDGRNLIYLKGSEKRHLETFLSAFQTGLYLFRHRHDYEHVFWFNNANAPGILLTLFSGIPVTVNTDGLEWKRKKWSVPFKLYYFITSWLISLFVPRLISDSRGIQKYYRKVFKRNTIMISYGIPEIVEVSKTKQEEILRRYDLEPEKYFLQITRFEPDNLPLEIAQSFLRSGLVEQGYQFVVVGYKSNTPYASRLYTLNGNEGIVVLPANYEQKILYTLRKNCFCYIHGNSVGGTNPALLEAMAICSRVLAIDVVFSREVLGEQGQYFILTSLDKMLIETLSTPDNRDELRKRVESLYQWDAVANSYMRIVEGQDPKYSPS